jgi:CBS domain-containing protein
VSIREILRQNRVFSKLPEESIVSLEQAARLIPFGEHDPLTGGGLPVHAIFLILKGYVRTVIFTEADEELTLHFYGPGDMFGWTAMYSGARDFPMWIGAEKGELLMLPHDVVHPAIRSSQPSMEEVNRYLAERLLQTYQDLAAETSSSAKGVDRYPLRMKVGDIMTTDVVTCTAETTVSEAARRMRERDIGSLVVMGERHEIRGILTDKDMVTRVLAVRANPDTTTVESVLTDKPIVITREAFYYEALLSMMNQKISHLPVADEKGLTGIVTMKDLLDAKSHHALDLTCRIEQAGQLQDLYLLADRVDELADRMKEEGMRAADICKVIADYDDRIHRRILHMIENELQQEGYGSPPVPYCWLQMGSGGRMEQPRRTDQDNALIFRDPPEHSRLETEKYFAVFAEKAALALESFGFPKCPGGVMASNPVWRKPLSVWKTELAEWILQPDMQGVRNLTIFLDFRPIYGTFEFAHELRLHVLYLVQNVPGFLHRLLTDDVNSQLHLGWFERELDLKTRLGVHFVNALRILSLKHGLPQVNSLERLTALTAAGVFRQEEFELYRETYEELMRYRVEGIRKIELGEVSKGERQRIKGLFHATKDLQAFMVHAFQLEGYSV